jgi:hypothetical protein
MATLENVLKIHEEICDEARSIIEMKGHDYNREQQKGGDTLFNMRVASLLGIVDNPCQGILVRLSDKFQRLNSLTKNPSVNPKVTNEAILDTVKDIVNYVVYLKIFYEEERLKAMGIMPLEVESIKQLGEKHTNES